MSYNLGFRKSVVMFTIIKIHYILCHALKKAQDSQHSDVWVSSEIWDN